MAQKRLSIYSALLANLLIAATKFVAGGFTNSSSMMSEGIHSLVDTTNEVLLLYGIRKSKKPPDKRRPFGYGKELYFWSFIVSILIFGLGGGLSVYQGVVHILHAEPLGDPTWNYVVLGFSFAFDGTSFVIAVIEFNAVRGNLSFWNAIVKSKDPSTFLVLLEDAADVLGLVIVFALLLCSQAFNLPVLDGVASVLVGTMLVAVSLLLARESRSLLMGEGIAYETQQQIVALAERDAAVAKVTNVLSTYQSPEEIVLMLIVAFKDDLSTADITDAIERIRRRIKEKFGLVRFVIVQPQAVGSA